MKNKITIALVTIIIMIISMISFIGCSTMSSATMLTGNNPPAAVAVENDSTVGMKGGNKPQSGSSTLFNPIHVGENNKAYPRKMMWSKNANGKWEVTMIENDHN